MTDSADICAFFLSLAARLRLSRFVVLAAGDTETHMRRWLMLSAFGALLVLAAGVSAFCVRCGITAICRE
jgi:hypothetical protein